jgi:hypothetical protein
MSSSKIMNITVPISANQLSKVRININLVSSDSTSVPITKQRIHNATVHLSGLSHYVKRTDVCDALTRILGSYGEISDIRIPVDLNTGFLKGYAFVVFKDPKITAHVLNRSAQLSPILGQYLLSNNITMASAKGF